MQTDRNKVLESLENKVSRYGDFNAYYYIHRGEVRIDVHLRGDGVFINSNDVAINPLRAMASDLIEIINKKNEKKKEDQLGLF